MASRQEIEPGPNGFRRLSFSTLRHWVVKKGLPSAEREGVALGIFMNATMEFEGLQGSFPFSVVSGGTSSFSIEDVISNVIGFYGAFKGISVPRLRQICGEVTVGESLRIWDEHLAGGLGAFKNRGLTPIKFPCPECDEQQTDTSFPSLFSSIRQQAPGLLWARVKNRFIDGRLTNTRQTLHVSSDGEVSVRLR
jgi:hypothetical protein